MPLEFEFTTTPMNNFSLDHNILINLQLLILTGGFFYHFYHDAVPLELAWHADSMLYEIVLVINIK